jgi:hypothetical protein
LLKLAEELLEILTEILEDAINLELGDGMVVADTIGERQCVFMKKLWDAERTIAERLRALWDGQPPWPTIEADKSGCRRNLASRWRKASRRRFGWPWRPRLWSSRTGGG